MKILEKDLKQATFRIQVTSLEDFWYLTQIISPEDKVIGTATRKIKLETGSEKSNVVKKKFTAKLIVEKLDMEKNASTLKINGRIFDSNTEDIANGSYQSINLVEGDDLTIIKDEIFEYQLEKLTEASKTDKDNILVCLLDRETAKLALINRNSIEVISNLEGEVAKKDERLVNIKSTFYSDINKNLMQLRENKKLTHIIIGASKLFQKEIEKQLDEQIKKITTFTIINSVSINGINEILRNPELENILKNKNIASNTKLVDDFFVELSREDKVAYGVEDVQMAADMGAIDKLILTESKIEESQENETFEKLNELLKTVSKMKGFIRIISSKNEPGKKIDSIGGIAAFLKYKIK